MAKNVSVQENFLGGAEVSKRLVIPKLAADPTGGDLTEALLWENTTTHLIKYYNGTSVLTLADTTSGSLDAEAVQDIVGAMLTDSSTIDAVYNDAGNVETLTVLNSPKLEGNTLAQVQTLIVAAIVDAAPGTLDTLNELAAALGDDPNFATTITASLATKARGAVGATTGGATSEVLTHNLNTRDVVVILRNGSAPYDEAEFATEATTVNTVTIRSDAGNIPASYRWIVIAPATY